MAETPRLKLPYPDEFADPWFEQFVGLMEVLDAALYTSREDKNIVIMGGGVVTWNASTSTITWASDIELLSSVSGLLWRITGPSSAVLSDGELIYITVVRNPVTNVTLSPVISTHTPNVPNGDDQLLIGYRRGSRLYFRNGRILNDGDSIALFEATDAGFIAGGDLSGTSTSQTVVRIQGRPVSAAVPLTGQALAWNGSQWLPTTITGFTAGGDLSGSAVTQTVIKINGATVPIAGALTTGNVLQVTGASVLGYGPINLGGGSAYVTGTLPVGNLPAFSTYAPYLYTELTLCAAVATNSSATPMRVAARVVLTTPFASTSGVLNRTVRFKATIETTAGTANIDLYNETDGETVTGTNLTTASTSLTEVSASLTLGAAAGNLKNNKMYSVRIWITGGGVSDVVTIGNARLEVTYE